MRHFAKAGIIIAVGAAIAVTIPGVRDRGTLLVRKVLGASAESWSDVAVQMVPYRWQEGARRILGHWAVEWARQLSFPLQLGPKTHLSYSIFLGATPNLASLDCHYTVLAEGKTPHPPHVHDDEEIIIPLVGDVDILRAAAADSNETKEERVGYGRLVYHTSGLPHTIRAVGPGPSGYLVLRWSAPASKGTPEGSVPPRSFDLREVLAAQPAATEGRSRTLIFEGPTRLLRRLHAHASFAHLGEGSAPHRDPHDVAVVVLQGAMETTSGRVEAPGIIFHPAGRTHFLRSVGLQPARYLAIEFLERD
ncbi:MAG: hypothetical protein L0387_12830 [Acidobacteria bacterium]|nr:hypothetical protein [Acidobacteriota bacterium]